MSPLEIDAAFADVFQLVDELKRANAALSVDVQGQRENVLRLQEQVAALQAEDAKEEVAPVFNVPASSVQVNVPAQAAPVVNNTIVVPEEKDKKYRVSYLDYTGNKKVMEIETVR
jgi:hypothetical protein